MSSTAPKAWISSEQMETLQAIGCTEMQGYLFGKARPAGSASSYPGAFKDGAFEKSARPEDGRIKDSGPPRWRPVCFWHVYYCSSDLR